MLDKKKKKNMNAWAILLYCMEIHTVAVDIFQSRWKWWTDQTNNITIFRDMPPEKKNANKKTKKKDIEGEISV